VYRCLTSKVANRTLHLANLKEISTKLKRTGYRILDPEKISHRPRSATLYWMLVSAKISLKLGNMLFLFHKKKIFFYTPLLKSSRWECHSAVSGLVPLVHRHALQRRYVRHAPQQHCRRLLLPAVRQCAAKRFSDNARRGDHIAATENPRRLDLLSGPFQAGLWIRINFNPNRWPAFQLNPDPDTDPC
jgi:hypothetical protein